MFVGGDNSFVGTSSEHTNGFGSAVTVQSHNDDEMELIAEGSPKSPWDYL